MKYFLLILGLFIFQNGFAQKNNIKSEPFLKLKSLNVENGLSQNSINTLLEDKDGFLWIGTDDGLNRYDGQNITIYKYIRSDKTTIPDNQINELYQDSKGRIWVGTLTGLALYDNNTNQFTSFRKDKITKDSINSLINNEVKAIVEDKNGFLWIGTGNGLSRLDTKTNSFTNYVASQSDSAILISNTINALTIDKENNLWIGTTKGINKWKIEKKHKQIYGYLKDNTTTVWTGDVNEFFIDKNETLWVATRLGLNKYLPKLNTFKTFPYSKNNDYNLQSINQTEDNILYGVGSNYIYKLNNATEELIRFQLNLTELGAMPSIIQTKDKTVWTASRNLGVLYFNPKRGFQVYRSEKNNKNSLPRRDIWAILKTEDSIIWVGTEAGLTKINKINNKYTHLTNKIKKENFKITSVTGLLETQKKELWIVGGNTISRMICPLDEEEATLVSLEKNENDSTTIQQVILGVFEDKKETVWINTFSGFYKMKPSQKHDFGYEGKLFLEDMAIWCIYEDKNEVLWLGTNKGLVKVIRDEKNNPIDFVFYKSDPKDLSSISNNFVRAITEDSKGTMWIGTTSGLNRVYKNENGKISFEHWGERNELANYAIYGILVDEKNNLWISTNRGLFKFLNDEKNQNIADDRRIIVYDTKDNLQSLEFNSGAFFRADDGEMFFGGINGFNSFYPKKIKPNTAKRKVILTDLKLFGKTVKVNQEKDDRVLLTKALQNTEKIELTYQDKIITIGFVSPNFQKPEFDTYLYKLEGFDEDWNKTKTIHQATYTNLPAGNYTFRIKVINGDNIESQETTLKINVSPPFWKTWWFISLCGLLVIGASLAFYKQKLNSIKAQNIKLEGLVNKRTSQLKEKNEEVNQQNEEIIQQNTKLETQQKLVEKAYKNVSLLSEVGKQITSHLSVEMIIEMVYESVNKIVDASVFSIGIYNQNQQRLDFFNAKEKGKVLPSFHKNLTTTDNLPAYCFNKNTEIIINDVQKEYNNFIPNEKLKVLQGEIPESLIYVPILYKNKTIGVLTVQSFKKHSYTKNQINLVRNIAVYAAIALVNARSYQQIEEQSNAITVQNQKITSSINYASRIQQAMLPPIENIKKAFGKAFVLWLPRDVVSGDFYWFAEVKNKVCIAAIDCTGHGVPGAFMSMIGSDMLNHIVLEKRITTPSLILKNLHQQVSRALRQSETQNQDGMDMTLCVYDKSTKELEFAGAKNPLYYIQDNQLNNIAGSKFPIGGKWGDEIERVYENHTLKIDKETTIFLCTDGYQDQFGGQKGKKLMKKKMKTLFTEIVGLEDTKQKQKLENYFFDWKKEEEQVDDVLVMGFKIK